MASLKHLLLPLLEKVLARNEITPQHVDLPRIKRVLVIRQHDVLGDFLLATPVFRALKETLPHATVGVIVRDYFADTVKHNPHIDEIMVIPKDLRNWTLRGFFKFLQQLRSGWDLVVVLSTVSHSLTSDLFAWFTNARWIVGSDLFPFPGCERNFFYNLIAKTHPGSRHYSDRNLDIVRHIGINTHDLSEEIALTKPEIEHARSTLAQFTQGVQKPITIGFHVGAGKTANRWPITSFASLMERLNSTRAATFLVFWGPKERDLVEELRGMLRFQPAFIPPSGLRELAAYFTLCNVVVCNDTGAMHLCAAVKTPLVAPFGPTRVDEWKPVGDQFVGVQASDGRIASVNVEQVLPIVIELIHQSH